MDLGLFGKSNRPSRRGGLDLGLLKRANPGRRGGWYKVTLVSVRRHSIRRSKKLSVQERSKACNSDTDRQTRQTIWYKDTQRAWLVSVCRCVAFTHITCEVAHAPHVSNSGQAAKKSCGDIFNMCGDIWWWVFRRVKCWSFYSVSGEIPARRPAPTITSSAPGFHQKQSRPATHSASAARARSASACTTARRAR